MKKNNTIFIKHRINSIIDLEKIPQKYGVEVDVRTYNNEIILHHDAFQNGDSFDEFLENFNHKFLIINIKCDGLEGSIIKKLEDKSIKNFFFLDSSIPSIVKMIRNNCKNIAVRYSKYEPIEFLMEFKNKVNWIWIDCFEGFDLKSEDYKIMSEYFKICLVSPELQGYSHEKIEEFSKLSKNMYFDAICTKFPELWEK
tara:strand:+ start:3407 stop:4000 length:594 start_codon:yes stop_codon:yes gene_type:complete